MLKNSKKLLHFLNYSIISAHLYIFNRNQVAKREDKIEVEGVIKRALPGLVFDVQLPEEFGGNIIQGHLSGKMRTHYIKLIEGDTVLVELSPYDLTKGRIVFRQK